jgi:hypothetical protein
MFHTDAKPIPAYQNRQMDENLQRDDSFGRNRYSFRGVDEAVLAVKYQE